MIELPTLYSDLGLRMVRGSEHLAACSFARKQASASLAKTRCGLNMLAGQLFLTIAAACARQAQVGV